MPGSLPLGLCILPSPPPNAARCVAHAAYMREILAHAGLCRRDVAVEELPDALPGLRLLVTVGDTALPEPAREALRTWVTEGGAWLAVGGTCGLPDLLGVEEETPPVATFGGGKVTLGEGYLTADHPLHPVLSHLRIPLHFFNGAAVRGGAGQVVAGILDAHQRPTHRAAVVEAAPGNGRTMLIAPDVTGSVVRIQQGVAVTRDGVPSPDGLAPDSDGVLKSDDGFVLDWTFDRQPIPGAPGLSAFLHPVADLWREVVLRAALHLASERRIPLPLLWRYPRNLPALAHMSHDTDGNDPALARLLLDALHEAQIQSTWCVILPGYEDEVLAAIRRAGHEPAMHFDAMSEGTAFTEEQFDRQWKALCARLGGDIVTNKNHYLRWEGDTEFFTWCEKRGIRMDQSKGASKTGEAGFNFGTCLPHFPVRPDGAPLDVLELPTPTQDLVVFAPPQIVDPLLDAVVRCHGVLHLLFHPAHIAKPGVADALKAAVEAAKARGLEWWTARRLNNWERARRAAHWSGFEAEPGRARITLFAGTHLAGATILWLAPAGGSLSVNGAPAETQTVQRHGFRFAAATFDATEGDHALEITTDI